jgi:ADP-heptose:LPS heptosyltransferase
MKKILIIRFSSIGDIVLTTPVIRCVKQQVDEAEVHFATKKAFSSLLKSNPYVGKVHVFEDDLNKLIAELKAENFDFVIDLHNNLRSRRVTSALGKPVSRFHKLNVEKWLMVNLKVNQLPERHIVDRYLSTAKELGVQNDGEGLDFFIPKAEEVAKESLPLNFQNGYIALVIGAKFGTKKLPVEKLKVLVKLIEKPIVIIGGPEDKLEGEKLAALHPETVFNACGEFSLSGSASLIRQASSVITHDTGMMHIAAAFNKPIFSIWGNTIPEFGMHPYLPHSSSKFFQVDGLSCRPCSKIGYSKCPKSHFNCMNQIDLKAIATAANSVQ